MKKEGGRKKEGEKGSYNTTERGVRWEVSNHNPVPDNFILIPLDLLFIKLHLTLVRKIVNFI